MSNGLGALFAFFFKYRPSGLPAGGLYLWGARAAGRSCCRRSRDRRSGGDELCARARERARAATDGSFARSADRGARGAAVCLMRPMLLLSRRRAAAKLRRRADRRFAEHADRRPRQAVQRPARTGFAIRSRRPSSALLKRCEAQLSGEALQLRGDRRAHDDDNRPRSSSTQNETRARRRARRPRAGNSRWSRSRDSSCSPTAPTTRASPIADELLSLRAQTGPGVRGGRRARSISRATSRCAAWRRRAACSKGSTLVADVLVRQRGFGGAKVAADGRGRWTPHRPVRGHAAAAMATWRRCASRCDADGGRAPAHLPDSAADRASR